jgi:hypothetical protein
MSAGDSFGIKFDIIAEVIIIYINNFIQLWKKYLRQQRLEKTIMSSFERGKILKQVSAALFAVRDENNNSHRFRQEVIVKSGIRSSIGPYPEI